MENQYNEELHNLYDMVDLFLIIIILNKWLASYESAMQIIQISLGDHWDEAVNKYSYKLLFPNSLYMYYFFIHLVSLCFHCVSNLIIKEMFYFFF